MIQEPINREQTENNDLTKISQTERNKLLPRNDFQGEINEYSVVHPDAMADGDTYGKGTGVFLDTVSELAGSSIDIVERKNNIKINEFNSKNTYPNF